MFYLRTQPTFRRKEEAKGEAEDNSPLLHVCSYYRMASGSVKQLVYCLIFLLSDKRICDHVFDGIAHCSAQMGDRLSVMIYLAVCGKRVQAVSLKQCRRKLSIVFLRELYKQGVEFFLIFAHDATGYALSGISNLMITGNFFMRIIDVSYCSEGGGHG
jgi:hypothetical protein